MTDDRIGHSHIFLAPGHEGNERKTWAVIWLCGIMMLVEIVGGSLYGSVALVADGLHMSTHAGAMLIAAYAYTYARRHASDARFTFGTGKIGDLAGFTSAIILAMIALLIGYESLSRLFAPVPINFNQAIWIAAVGLVVNVASVWLLSGGEHHAHAHAHSHGHSHHLNDVEGSLDHSGQHHGEEVRRFSSQFGPMELEIYEEGVAPRFRLRALNASPTPLFHTTLQTVRPDGSLQIFAMDDKGNYLESVEAIPEPHEFVATVVLSAADTSESHVLHFEEHHHHHAKTHQDNNFRAAFVHVIADAAVSVLVIAGLLLAKTYGWLWIDPLVGVVGSLVIANWAYGLLRDTGAILLDMNAEKGLCESIRSEIESGGDQLVDLHVWRLGPGHLGAIVSVATRAERAQDFYRARMSRFKSLSHLTIEVFPQ